MMLSPAERLQLALDAKKELAALEAEIKRHDAARDWTVAGGRAIHTRLLTQAARLEGIEPSLAGDFAFLARRFSEWLSPYRSEDP